MLYLDEPTTGLDPLSRNEMWDIVRDLTATGVAVLLTTQYLEEADHIAAEIAVVDHGTVIATGTPRELKARAGAQILAVRPAHPVDLPAVISIVTEFTLAAPEVSNSLVTAPVPDPAVLPAVVRRLDDAGVLIAELLAVGALLGFRIGTGPLGVLGAFALLLVCTLAVSWAIVLVSMLAANPEKVQIFGFVVLFPLAFTSDAFVRTASMPGPLLISAGRRHSSAALR